MAGEHMRDEMIRRLAAAAAGEPRIVGLLDYGSELGVDAWSDLDVEVFVVDEAFDEIREGWMDWAGRLGDVLLSFWFESPGAHPWLIYAAEPVPLRVDYSLHRASEIETIEEWPNAPVSTDVVLHDTTGRLLRAVAPLVGRDLPPMEERRLFESSGNTLWTCLLRSDAQRRRRDRWYALQGHAWLVMGSLAPLLKLEATPTRERKWMATMRHLDAQVSPRRRAELEACWPRDEDDLGRAMLATARLGAEVSAAISAREGWPWPAELARRIEAALAAP